MASFTGRFPIYIYIFFFCVTVKTIFKRIFLLDFADKKWIRVEFGHAVSVIVVVGLENLSCCCDHCVKVVNVANKPDKNNVRQGLLPQNLILFRSHVTSVFQGLSLSLSRRRAGRREPWERGWHCHACVYDFAC